LGLCVNVFRATEALGKGEVLDHSALPGAIQAVFSAFRRNYGEFCFVFCYSVVVDKLYGIGSRVKLEAI
jgi:hypothetical protein